MNHFIVIESTEKEDFQKQINTKLARGDYKLHGNMMVTSSNGTLTYHQAMIRKENKSAGSLGGPAKRY